METAPSWLVGGEVLTPAGDWARVSVGIQGQRIVAIQAEPEQDGQRVDLNGARLVPGLIETHIHGVGHDDVMDADDGGLRRIAEQLPRHGITAWCPTTVACPSEKLEKILNVVSRAQKHCATRACEAQPWAGAEILGAHLESNFLSPRYKGAQPEAWLRRPDEAQDLRALIRTWSDAIQIVTLAPELPGAIALIQELVEAGITVAVGHSDATYHQVADAVAAGARRITHLCNAQRGFHHREPGVLGAGLVMDDLFAEIIADLHHVHPAGLEIARRCKGPRRLMLVSDSLRGTGLPPGEYELGGQQTILDGEVARLADGTIAGSTITLDRAIATMTTRTDTTWADAFGMASAVPAESLGLKDRGAIAPGMLADLAIFAENSALCLGTLVKGRWAYGPKAPIVI
jgi:N-acetylglucosamine-6-phosphate deacetylase